MIPIKGATLKFERAIRDALSKYPEWFVRAARIDHIEVSNAPDVKAQIAVYEHGSRKLSVWPGVGSMLQKALGHELFHAVDDNFNNPHFFTSTPEWKKIHADAGHFDIGKYATEALEYFADMGTKLFLLGPAKLRTTNPMEVQFITSWVIPTLQKAFGG